tara:strand:+ start:4239 stop:4382 length:144 start_codon:yes stop_codon:yes gene_type:complete
MYKTLKTPRNNVNYEQQKPNISRQSKHRKIQTGNHLQKLFKQTIHKQ